MAAKFTNYAQYSSVYPPPDGSVLGRNLVQFYPPSAALVMPITQPGQQQALAGLLVMGISPRRAFDDEYRGFFDLVVNSVATAMAAPTPRANANARAYEAERTKHFIKPNTKGGIASYRFS